MAGATGQCGYAGLPPIPVLTSIHTRCTTGHCRCSPLLKKGALPATTSVHLYSNKVHYRSLPVLTSTQTRCTTGHCRCSPILNKVHYRPLPVLTSTQTRCTIGHYRCSPLLKQGALPVLTSTQTKFNLHIPHCLCRMYLERSQTRWLDHRLVWKQLVKQGRLCLDSNMPTFVHITRLAF